MKKLKLYLLLSCLTYLVHAQFPTDTYWTDENGLHFFDLETNESKLLFSSVTQISEYIVPDVINQKLYYLSHGEKRLNRVDYDGGNQTPVFNLSEFDEFDETRYRINAVAFHPDFSKIFISVKETIDYLSVATSPSIVYSIDLNSGEIIEEWQTTFFREDGLGKDYQDILDVKIDPVNNRLLYIRSEDDTSVIVQRDLNGDNPQIVLDNITQVRLLAIHEENQSMFFTGGGRGFPSTMHKASLDGSESSILFQSTFRATEGFLVNDSTDRLYFYDVDNEIISCNLNGSDFKIEEFPADQLPLALDPSTNEGFDLISPGRDDSPLVAIDLDFPDSYVFREIIRSLNDVYELAFDEINERLFYRSNGSDSRVLYSMDLDGSNIERIALFGDFIGYDWVLDPDEGRVITLEKDESGARNTAVYSRSLDDLGRSLISDLGSAIHYHTDWSPAQNRGFAFRSGVADFNDDVVYDFKNDMAYFMVDGEAIFKSDDPTSQGEEFIFFEVVNGDYLIKDERAEQLYWSNTGAGSSRGFYRVNFDGSGVEKVGDNPIYQAVLVYENLPPALVSEFENVTLDEDADVYQIPDISDYFNDPEGATLTVTAFSEISEVTVSIEENDLSINLADNYNGVSEITVSATDGNKSISTTFDLSVEAVNDAPSFMLSDNALNLDSDFATITIVVTSDPIPSDESDQNVSYHLEPASVDFADIEINAETGNITIKSLEELGGSQNFLVVADDGQTENNIHSVSFTLTVNPAITLGTDYLKDHTPFYPNPSKSMITLVSIPNFQMDQIKIIDTSGKQVKSVLDAKDQTIDISNLKAGQYFLIFQNGKKIRKEKLIKIN